MLFRQLIDLSSCTYTYLLADARTREAVIVDSVESQHERDAALIDELGLRLLYALETHVHADHVSGAWQLQRRFGCQTVASAASGAAADVVIADWGAVRAGKLVLEARYTPGHTNGCVTWVTGDKAMAFTGDALLVRGCGRTDLQGGDARALYHSVHDRIFSLPDDARLYPGHDYKGRTVTTVHEERQFNPRLGGGKSEAEFAEIMRALMLAAPARMNEWVPANLLFGRQDASDDVDIVPLAPWAPVARSATGTAEVSTSWVAAHAAQVRIVDVREPDELHAELGHIVGVEPVPLATVVPRARGWGKEDAIVLVCRSGGRSGRAADELERAGFRRVASMAGGMLRWAAEARPTMR